MYDQCGYQDDIYSSSYPGSATILTASVPSRPRKSVKSRLGVRIEAMENNENASAGREVCCPQNVKTVSRNMSPLRTSRGLTVNSPSPGTPLRDEDPWVVLDEAAITPVLEKRGSPTRSNDSGFHGDLRSLLRHSGSPVEHSLTWSVPNAKADSRTRLQVTLPGTVGPDLRTQLNLRKKQVEMGMIDGTLNGAPLCDSNHNFATDCNRSTTPLHDTIRRSSKILVQWAEDLSPTLRKKPDVCITSANTGCDKPSPIPVLINKQSNFPHLPSPTVSDGSPSTTWGNAASSLRKTPQKLRGGSRSRKESGPSPIPIPMTKKSLSSLPAWARLGISDYLGETKARNPLMVSNKASSGENAKQELEQESYAKLHTQDEGRRETAGTAATAVIRRGPSRKLITSLEKMVGMAVTAVKDNMKKAIQEVSSSARKGQAPLAPRRGQKNLTPSKEERNPVGESVADRQCPSPMPDTTSDNLDDTQSSPWVPQVESLDEDSGFASLLSESASCSPDSTTPSDRSDPRKEKTAVTATGSLKRPIEALEDDGDTNNQPRTKRQQTDSPKTLEDELKCEVVIDKGTTETPATSTSATFSTTAEQPAPPLTIKPPTTTIATISKQPLPVKDVEPPTATITTKQSLPPKTIKQPAATATMATEHPLYLEPPPATTTTTSKQPPPSSTTASTDKQPLPVKPPTATTKINNKQPLPSVATTTINKHPLPVKTVKPPTATTTTTTDEQPIQSATTSITTITDKQPLHLKNVKPPTATTTTTVKPQMPSATKTTTNKQPVHLKQPSPVKVSKKPPPPAATTTNNKQPPVKKLKKSPPPTTMQPPPVKTNRPCKRARKPVPFDTTASPLPIGPVTKLQLDLDQILLSIRRVFLVNHLTHSVLSLEVERDTCVAEMKATTHAYSHFNLVEKEGRQNFSCWQVRWGYMFMYLMRHAHLVFLSLKHLHLIERPITSLNHIWNIPFDCGGTYLTAFLQKCRIPGGVLKVCAIGGGPGSDLMGLALFLRANNFPVRIRAVVFDKCGHWSRSWEDLHRELPPMLASYFEPVQYIPFDYLCPELSPVHLAFVTGADLITIVKSMSPVATKLWNVKPIRLPGRGPVKAHSLFNILSSVSSGAMVLYVDNRSGQQTEVMQETVQSVPGFTMVHYETSTEKLPRSGFSPLCQKFMQWVGYGPSFNSGNNEIVALSRQWMFEYY